MIKRDWWRSDDRMSFEFNMMLFTVCCGLISKKTNLEVRILMSYLLANDELSEGLCLPTTCSASPCLTKEKRLS